MNLDIASTLNFGDSGGLRQFLLDHYLSHLAISQALVAAKGVLVSTVGLKDPASEDAWVTLMQNQEGPTPQSLRNWLILHNTIHQSTDQLLVASDFNVPDLSVANFAQPGQFYDWMFVHQQMHDFETQALKIQ